MNDLDYNVIINRKNIKNLYIRIDKDLNVVVNANKELTTQGVYNVLRLKDDWIKKRIEIMKKRYAEVDDLQDKTIGILGRRYKIDVIKSDEDKIDLEKDKFILYSKEDDIEYQTVLINDYLKKTFDDILNKKLICECKLRAEEVGIRRKFTLRTRIMKTRFGSYSVKTDRICLNVCLVKYSEDIIKSVLLHEMCHMRFRNHQKWFYRTLYKMCPEYDKFCEELKSDFFFKDTWFLV
ncbi:M48 family metallopeptidase [Anaerofustis stercorihominis]|uniref:M48 family metallopeptidase n=1 Tax=Anaerofustis stercorihominis TaxID=214853 RepID=UPI00214AAA77|nr:M48 family metallopeptidase [Anaerofustis stercorihominis]MCR2033496.1 M48 family metallopeptidase [Anaerofustis stercorihominis]